jgi:hypothetical protein
MKFLLPALGLLFVVGCTAVQLSELQNACDNAISVANRVSFVPGAKAIAPYVHAGCSTAEGLAKLSSDPSSTDWVNNLTIMLKAL